MGEKSRKWRGRDLKRKVLDLLKEEDLRQILETLRSLPARQVINPLFSFLCSKETEIKWRAVTAIGVVVANLAQDDMESARVVMRRMIWNLNDESGGIGWGCPEAMGEIMARHEELSQEYANILISYVRKDGNYLEHEPLQQGVLWGLGRLAQARPELLQGVRPHLLPFLKSKEANLRGLAAWTLGFLSLDQVDPGLETLVMDDAEITIYDDGTERTHRVGDLARKALAKN